MITLHYKQFGAADAPPLLILHGLLGMSDNWYTLAQRFAEQYRVYAIDQRNHGRSPHTATHTYADLSDDLLHFAQQHQLDHFCLIGHSMGGKTAMHFATQHSDYIDRLVVVDIAPKSYPDGEHNAIFEALLSLPPHTPSRAHAEQHLLSYPIDATTRQFLLKNLYRTEQGSYAWRCNAAVLWQYYRSILGNSLSYYDVLEQPTVFVKGGLSERYINPNDDLSVIQHHFPLAELCTIEGAAHWVHAEQPNAFYTAVSRFLQG